MLPLLELKILIKDTLSNLRLESKLIEINEIIRNHPVEVIGKELRGSMTAMKKLV